MPTITVGIPCYKPHLVKLQRLLDSLEAQTRKPDEVIVSTSSTLPEDIPKLPTYSFPVILIVDAKRRKAAENRNNCFRLARCDIVSVIDSDDVCHKQRLEFIEKAFMKGAEFVLHGFSTNLTDLEKTYTDDDNVIQMNVLQRAPSGCAVHKHNMYLPIHHGHSSATKELVKKLEVGESPYYDYREDTLYCWESLGIVTSNAYLNMIASYYEPTGTQGNAKDI
jgi:glycosyltransferase involved in cell wall biosynthesis